MTNGFEKYNEALRDLVMFHLELEDSVIKDGYTELSSMLFPFCSHGINQVRAALLLASKGLIGVADSNLRSAQEHMLWAQWLLWTDDSEGKAFKDIGAESLKLLRDPASPKVTISQDVLDHFGGDESREMSASKLAQRFGKYQYGIFRILSASVHPSSTTMVNYGGSDFLIGEGDLLKFSARKLDTRFFVTSGIILACLISPPLYLLEDSSHLHKFAELCQRYELPLDLADEDKQNPKKPSKKYPGTRRPDLNPYRI